MSAFDRIREPGEWAEGTPVHPNEMEVIDANLVKAPNFADGGAYAPTTPIEVGAGGLRTPVLPTTADGVANREYVDLGEESTIAHLTLQDLTITPGNKFTLELVASYSKDGSGGWTLVSGTDLQVPTPGLYRVTVVRLVADGSPDGNDLKQEILCGAAQVGFSGGSRYGNTSDPVDCSGGCLIPILGDVTTQRISLRPLNGTNQSIAPEAAPGQLHCVMVERLGKL